MRIGLDAKWYFTGPTGPRTVVRNLINHLARVDNSNEYIVYLNKNDDANLVEYQAPNFVSKTLAPSQSWLRVMLKFSQVAHRDKLDVLLTHNFCPLWAPCKRVIFVHDLIFRTHPELFTLVERVFFLPMGPLARRADVIQTNSEYTAESVIREYGVDRASLATTLLACDDAFRQPCTAEKLAGIREKYKLPKRFILYVGRLNVRKNLIRLIQAFEGVDDSEIELVIVGAKDWKSSDLAPLVTRSPVHSRLRFLGYVPDEDLPLIYKLAEVFAYVPLAEGFGLPPLEAMASGVPVITSNTSAIPEVVGDTALTVDPTNVTEIRDALNRMLSSPELRSSLGAAGAERARIFSWEEMARQTSEILMRAHADGKSHIESTSI